VIAPLPAVAAAFSRRPAVWSLLRQATALYAVPSTRPSSVTLTPAPFTAPPPNSVPGKPARSLAAVAPQLAPRPFSYPRFMAARLVPLLPRRRRAVLTAAPSIAFSANGATMRPAPPHAAVACSITPVPSPLPLLTAASAAPTLWRPAHATPTIAQLAASCRPSAHGASAPRPAVVALNRVPAS
jgi:hypothetical protein